MKRSSPNQSCGLKVRICGTIRVRLPRRAGCHRRWARSTPAPLRETGTPYSDLPSRRHAIVMAMALPASAKIAFHRIVYDPFGSDTGTNSHLNQEMVVLHNTGARTRRIGNWRIRDVAGHRYTLPDGFRLGADRYVRVHTGRGTNDSNDLYWGSGWYIWNNTGDRATLRNAVGTVIDRCSYAGGGSVKNC